MPGVRVRVILWCVLMHFWGGCWVFDVMGSWSVLSTLIGFFVTFLVGQSRLILIFSCLSCGVCCFFFSQ